MARKGIMNKNPSRVAGILNQPTNAATGLQRLSPGVYRNAQGNLVGNKGQAIPGARPPMPRPAPQRPAGQSLTGAMQPPAQPPMQPPAPQAAPPSTSFPQPPMPQGNPADQVAGSYQQPQWRQPAPYGQNEPMMRSAVMPEQMPGQMYRDFQGGNFSPEQMSQLYQRFQQPQQQMGQLQPGEQYAQQSPEEYAATLAKKRAFVQQQQMGQQYNPMQAPQRIPAQQNMQPQQGIVADRQPTAPQGQMSPTELQAIQNGTFKGYNY